MTYYANPDTIKLKVGLEGETTSTELINASIISAQTFIERKLRRNKLKIPSTSSILTEAANMYGIADALQPHFTAGEEENKKVLYYLGQAEDILDDYINTELDRLAVSGNIRETHPYSVSQSHISLDNSLDDIIK